MDFSFTQLFPSSYHISQFLFTKLSMFQNDLKKDVLGFRNISLFHACTMRLWKEGKKFYEFSQSFSLFCLFSSIIFSYKHLCGNFTRKTFLIFFSHFHHIDGFREDGKMKMIVGENVNRHVFLVHICLESIHFPKSIFPLRLNSLFQLHRLQFVNKSTVKLEPAFCLLVFSQIYWPVFNGVYFSFFEHFGLARVLKALKA